MAKSNHIQINNTMFTNNLKNKHDIHESVIFTRYTIHNY